MREYSEDAVERAKEAARDWLDTNCNGYPRTWAQEEADTERRGYDLYDVEAPPIAGYEALEREGAVKRMGTVFSCGQERIHFRIIPVVSRE